MVLGFCPRQQQAFQAASQWQRRDKSACRPSLSVLVDPVPASGSWPFRASRLWLTAAPRETTRNELPHPRTSWRKIDRRSSSRILFLPSRDQADKTAVVLVSVVVLLYRDWLIYCRSKLHNHPNSLGNSRSANLRLVLPTKIWSSSLLLIFQSLGACTQGSTSVAYIDSIKRSEIARNIIVPGRLVRWATLRVHVSVFDCEGLSRLVRSGSGETRQYSVASSASVRQPERHHSQLDCAQTTQP